MFWIPATILLQATTTLLSTRVVFKTKFQRWTSKIHPTPCNNITKIKKFPIWNSVCYRGKSTHASTVTVCVHGAEKTGYHYPTGAHKLQNRLHHGGHLHYTQDRPCAQCGWVHLPYGPSWSLSLTLSSFQRFNAFAWHATQCELCSALLLSGAKRWSHLSWHSELTLVLTQQVHTCPDTACSHLSWHSVLTSVLT